MSHGHPAPAEVRRLCLDDDVLTAVARLRDRGLDTAAVSALLCEGAPSSAQPGRQAVVLSRADGASAEMMVVVPEHAAGQRLGALLFLHGAGSDGGRVADLAAGLGRASQAVVLCPTATASSTRGNNFDLGGLLGRRLHHARWHYTAQDFPMLALRWARQHLNVDPNRCAIAGHSMGAVATWNIAARLWSALSAAAPINGALSVWERFGPDPEADALRPNLSHLAIHAVHGTADKRIPFELEHDTVRELRQAGHQRVQLTAVDGGEHPLNTMNMVPGAPHFEALGAWLALQRRADWPQQVRHRVFGASHARAHWVEVTALQQAGAAAEVVAQVVAPETIDIRTRGVARLQLHLHRRIVAPGPLRIIVNGRVHRQPFEPRLETLVASYRDTLDTSMVAEHRVSIDAIEHTHSTQQGELI